MRPPIPHFLAGGVNIIRPWEVNGSGHPGDSLDRWSELRIIGGVGEFVLKRGCTAIRDYLDGLRPWVARGGYIPFCDPRCAPDVDPDACLYYLDAKRELFG